MVDTETGVKFVLKTDAERRRSPTMTDRRSVQTNICALTDAYKENHWSQYPDGTEIVYSYFESRTGAKYPIVPFFGLQYILIRHFVGNVVTREGIDEAETLCRHLFGADGYFNRAGWEHILSEHEGRLPLSIKAVPEGTPVTANNVLMTVENTDPMCYWLTNFAETLLSQVWYPSTVSALSYAVKQSIRQYHELTSENALLEYSLHDFGYRGATCYEAAGIGGAAHLLHFLGTDTLAAIETARDFYGAPYEGLAASVRATEHSIMTALGKDGEAQVLDDLLTKYPDGILSVVADSYDIYRFVDEFVGEKFQQCIAARKGVLVVRPDSVTTIHSSPQAEMVWILDTLRKHYGATLNAKGYCVLHPKVRVLWGDGLDPDKIHAILSTVTKNGYASENIACFGMGGGLLQKVHRDVQRFAFKSSAQCRNGEWHDIWKQPLDASKASKRGRMKLVKDEFGFMTVSERDPRPDALVEVFRDGALTKEITFAEARENTKR